jgi:ribosomal protein L11 methyltransferase
MSGSSAGSWIEVQVELPAEVAELVAAELAELCGGIELRDGDTVFPTARDRAAVVALCQPEALDDVLATTEQVLATARAAGAEVDPVAIRQRAAHEDEWRDVWKQFFRTTRIGARFIVRPSWDQASVAAGDGDHVIELDPGRAFGTGAHPSTRLVIGALERLCGEGFAAGSFLDLGCGSGILSIAAHRLWPAARGLAVDVDPEATACTEENFALNHTSGVATRTGTLQVLAGERFDLILANIQRDVLELIADELVGPLAAGGRLVLSGLLTGDAGPVQACYEAAGWQLLGRSDEGEWASLLLGRRG